MQTKSSSYCILFLFIVIACCLTQTILAQQPVAVNDTFIIRSPLPQLYNLLLNDSIRYEFKMNTFKVVDEPRGGFEVVKDGGLDKVMYQADYENDEPDYFKYAICHENGNCDTAQVMMVKCPPKNPTFPTVDIVLTKQGEPVTFEYPSKFIQLTLKYLQNGTIEMSQDSSLVVYQPDPDFTGADRLKFSVYERIPHCGMHHYESIDNRIYVMPPNQDNAPPVATLDEVEVRAGRTIRIDVLKNDFDPEGVLDPRIKEVKGGRYGTVRRNVKYIKYTARRNVKGTDKLTYTICDFNGECSEGKIHVKVK